MVANAVENKYHYTYKITNTITGKYYIGMHTTSNLEDGYFGSGKILKSSIKKYGRDNHRKEIIAYFETRESLVEHEKELINEDILNDPMCMNLKLGGEGGGSFTKEQQLENNRRSQAAQQYLREHNSEWAQNEREWAQQHFSKLRSEGRIPKPKPHRTGEFKHTEQTKQYLSKHRRGQFQGCNNPSYGRSWFYNPETNENGKFVPGSEPMGWIRGRCKKKQYLCIDCGIKISKQHNRCNKCANANRIQQNPSVFKNRKQEFFDLYNQGYSKSKTLQLMGYNPSCSRKIKLIKQWLEEIDR